MPELKRVEISEDKTSATLRLRNVRLSFPNLFQPRAFGKKQEGTPKYNATFLFDKEGDAEKNMQYAQQAVNAVIAGAFKGKSPGKDKLCLRDGADIENESDGYGPEMMYLRSSNAKRIPVVDRLLEPITEADDKIYAGCYVNATVRLWAQDNDFGRRVNAQLQAVQFFRDGEPFGSEAAKPENEFSKIEEETEEDSVM